MSNTVTLKGGCLCGAVQYQWTGESPTASYCHCDDCRKATGGPYTVGVGVDVAGLTVAGEIAGYTKTADSGKLITREFCPKCGSPLFTRSELHPDKLWIKGGSLDTPELIKMTHQSWIDHAVSWAYIDKNLPAHKDNGPPPGQETA
ncbi:MAG: GFA family protein [Planctomycetota bacterium]